MDIIFDIDGTIADIEHRRVYVRSKPKNWRAFIKAIPKDGLIVPTATILVALADAGHNIIEDRRDGQIRGGAAQRLLISRARIV